MLYYLFRFLEQYNIPGSHLWTYISFRALLALIFSLVISAFFRGRGAYCVMVCCYGVVDGLGLAF